MKFIDGLEIDETEILLELVKSAENHRTRQRAHAIILSHKKYSVEELSDIFEVHRDTISRWLDSYEECGISGLFDAPKPGRPKVHESTNHFTFMHKINKLKNFKEISGKRYQLANEG